MKTTEIVLHVPEISLSAVASAYIDFAAFLFTLAALSYICFRGVAPYINSEKGKEYTFVASIFLVILALVPVAFASHIVDVMDVTMFDKERVKELQEKEEAYDDYFEVEEDAG